MHVKALATVRFAAITIITQTVVYLHYSSTDVQRTTEYFVNDLASILGTIGGSMGLFLGISAISPINLLLDYLKSR